MGSFPGVGVGESHSEDEKLQSRFPPLFLFTTGDIASSAGRDQFESAGVCNCVAIDDSSGFRAVPAGSLAIEPFSTGASSLAGIGMAAYAGMRILFVHERFGFFGGAEVNLHLVATELAARHHALGLLHGPGSGMGEGAWQNTFAERMEFGPQAGATVREALRRFTPDVVYVHKLSDPDALRALAEASVPVVRMVHDHDLYCLRSYKYHPLTRRICDRPASLHCIFPCGATLVRQRGGWLPVRWLSYGDKREEIRLNQRFARMVVAGQFMREELLRNGFAPERIEIHAPVPRPAEDGFVSSSFSERNLILFAGQIIRGKGVDVLIEALARVTVPFECMILGDGHHRAHCEALAQRLGLADRVKFMGYVPPDQVRTFYRECSVVAVSSVWPEPFGMVGIEAMRLGLPVVAFDAGGIRDWLVDGHNGFLVPWMDRGAFAQRIETLLRDKVLARRLGEQGRQEAGQRFDFHCYVGGLEELFQRVVRESASRPPAG